VSHKWQKPGPNFVSLASAVPSETVAAELTFDAVSSREADTKEGYQMCKCRLSLERVGLMGRLHVSDLKYESAHNLLQIR
jgi:hypothetical protein